jgi:hypothetical protein
MAAYIEAVPKNPFQGCGVTPWQPWKKYRYFGFFSKSTVLFSAVESYWYKIKTGVFGVSLSAISINSNEVQL